MDIKELECAHAAATQGDWNVDEESENQGESFVIQTTEKVVGWIAATCVAETPAITAEDRANARFIAIGHKMTPTLLEAVELLAWSRQLREGFVTDHFADELDARILTVLLNLNALKPYPPYGTLYESPYPKDDSPSP
jgi:hypothetical protein